MAPRAMIAFALLMIGVTGQLAGQNVTYPKTDRDDKVADDYFGTMVSDPYRWLENADDERLAGWIAAQNVATNDWMTSTADAQRVDLLLEWLTVFDPMGVPDEEGAVRFFQRRAGLYVEPGAITYDSRGNKINQSRVLVPTEQRIDGKLYLLVDWWPSWDGKLVAVALSREGSQDLEIRFVNSGDGTMLDDRLPTHSDTDLSWLPGGREILYMRAGPESTPVPSRHTVGSADDTPLGLGDLSPEHTVIEGVSEDGKLAIISAPKPKSKDGVHIAYSVNLAKSDTGPKQLFEQTDFRYRFIGSHGPTLFFWTDAKAPLGRIVSLSAGAVADVEGVQATEIVAQDDLPLYAARLIRDRIVAMYLKDVRPVLRTFDLQGKLIGEPEMPVDGWYHGFDASPRDKYLYFSVEDFLSPAKVYRFEMDHSKLEDFHIELSPFTAGDYVVDELKVPVESGVEVPIFVVRHEDTPAASKNAILLHAYGARGIPLFPQYRALVAAWLDLGGVWVQANIRGGGEYGPAWHDAARGRQKPNSMKDLLAVSKWLIDNKYTTSERLGLIGVDLGALAMASVMLSEHGLYNAVIGISGIYDVLRAEAMSQGPASLPYVTELGSVSLRKDCAAMVGYAPMLLKARVAPPPTLLIAGMRDDVINPAHTYKMAAMLQYLSKKSGGPVLLRVFPEGGHLGLTERENRQAGQEILAFAARNLGVRVP